MMRAFKILAAILILGLVTLVAVGYSANDPRAVHKDAWDRTGAVRWSFFEQHHYVWDRDRNLVELKWGDSRALFRTGDQTGRVWSHGNEQTGADAEEALRAAYAYWINDSFWLNPVVKLFDPGVERSLVKLDDGRNALLISYTSGGVTPGDAYLWIPGPDGMPASWRMW
ncbi:MAG: hypothetical protein JRJ80_11630, partial [Deltaproteobacteria bacterium]|nr:hypothetical protein [Deltaproteobacteria bacterium]